jgi:hypothetical protein
MERDVIEVCKHMMTGMLVSGGAGWEEARETVEEVVGDCLDDPEYCEAFVRHLRGELEARHGNLPLVMGRFVIVKARRAH